MLRGPRIGATFQGTLYDRNNNMDMIGITDNFRMCRNWVATKSRLSQLAQRHSISFTTRTALSFQPENA
ncbi:hypothetical protein MES5069_230203 [Mesorhizobium escarrei]|uniref:Uncharacterized protein n=1 Tax=Mesorhizobium escarrei TaxID=666018 RepID=A0ABN8JRC0_9HYPH|nr:hypothetical protein MES5069_230203 [Mesorhizobium escarrei]